MGSLHSEQELLKRLVIDEARLHDILYGRWAEWGGRRPPDAVRQRLLQKIPKGIFKHVPSEVFLDVSTVSCNRIGIFAACPIEEKAIIGPVPGSLVDSQSADGAGNSWEVLDEHGSISSYLHILDGRHGSWMGLIQDARYAGEQNLEMFQDGSDICYRVMKDIEAGGELLVWYGIQYPQCLGIPFFEPHKHKTDKLHHETDSSNVISVPAIDEDKKKVSCVLCHKGFNSRSNLRSHMRTHTNQKPFKCSTCGRRFSQSSTLRNHIRLHTGEKPYKCSICHSAYSQLAGLRAHQKSSQHRPKQQPESLKSK